MQYDLQIEDVSSIRRRLRFTLPDDVVKAEIERAFSDLKSRVKLAGFRPGKVPRNVLEARFGKQIRSEVGQRLIERSYSQAAPDLEIAGAPAVEDRGEILSGAPFTFTVAVDVRPKVEVKDYKGLKIDYPLREVTDELVDANATRELSRRARIQEVAEDRPVQAGDFVLASVRFVVDGEVLADEPGTMLHTRGERYYPGVDALVLGLSKGGEATASVTIGDASEMANLRGKTGEATVKVLAIHSHAVPELTDEVASELGYEGGVEGMKATIRMRLQESAEDSARNQARVDLLQKLVAANPTDVPRGLVDEQYQLLVEEMRVRRAYEGQDPRRIRFSEAELADLRERAAFAAKASCLLSGIARQEGVKVEASDLDAKIQEIADMRGQAVEAIRGYLEREGAMGMLEMRILEERVLDWLMENAELVQVTPGVSRDVKDIQGEGDTAAQADAPAQAEAPATEQAAPEGELQAAAVGTAEQDAVVAEAPAKAPRKRKTAKPTEG